MNILFLTKYGPKAASTRHRFLQYIPFMKNYGINCIVSPLFDDVYLEKKFNTGKSGIIDVLRALLRRALAIIEAKKYDLVVLHCEAFPYLPPLFEMYLRLRHITYIYDYDDAIFHNYDQHSSRLVRWLFRKKIYQVIAGAASVHAGSEYLARYARMVNKHVVLLPTVIDIDRYLISAKKRATKPFTIGWIGSPSTATYLKTIAPALYEFCAKHDAQVILVGSGQIELSGIPIKLREWSRETEVEEIMQFDVGIMPLPDTPWARGKCGFKLIQYMACGLPVIASPVGVNTEIVEPGKNGYLASNLEEWVNALTCLRNDKALCTRLGMSGRKKVETDYCVQVIAPRLAELFRQSMPLS